MNNTKIISMIKSELTKIDDASITKVTDQKLLNLSAKIICMVTKKYSIEAKRDLISELEDILDIPEYADFDMDEDAKEASIPYTYNAPQHDWKCGYPDITKAQYYNKRGKDDDEDDD